MIVRGSGEVTRRLSALGAAAGTRVLAHADGGGVLYLDASADARPSPAMVERQPDRLGVCNRLNLLLIDRARATTGSGPSPSAALRERGLTPSLPPHAHPLGHEWALDAGNEAHVTVAPVDGPVDAALTRRRARPPAWRRPSCAQDADAATAFIDAYTGTGAFWNAPPGCSTATSCSALPETGINVDHMPARAAR